MRVLILGTNWIGDTIMSMPAIQAYRRRHPEAHLTMLVKKGLVDLWRMHSAPDDILVIEPGIAGTWRTARHANEGSYDCALVLPNSFRSALIPFLAGVRERIGMPGHGRAWLLTRVTAPPADAARAHQAWEYMELFGLGGETRLEAPGLTLPDDAIAEAGRQLGEKSDRWVALMPGAARGPAKRWPEPHFISVGRQLAELQACRVAVMGSAAEASTCARIAEEIGAAAVNLAGRSSLPVWAALLKSCALALCNDSGGMHLAAAVGTPVVAVFGITDPAKTGPVGGVHRILQHSAVRSRDVSRDSEEAAKSLASILPQQVYEAALGQLDSDR